MSIFTEILSKTKQVALLRRAATSGSPAMAVGLSNIHKANLIACLIDQPLRETKKQTAFVLTEDEATANRLCDDFNRMSEQKAVVFPYREPVFRPMETASQEYEQLRMKNLSQLASGELSVVFTSVAAALSLLPPPQTVLDASFSLKSEQEISIENLTEKLLASGYVRREQVEGQGQFSVRGGIVDIFPISSSKPVRIEFWGDEIDTISHFDLETQRRTDSIKKVPIFPASEFLVDGNELAEKLRTYRESHANALSKEATAALQRDEALLQAGTIANYDKYLTFLYPKAATLFDYLPDSILFVSEWASIKQAGEGSEAQWEEDLLLLTEEGEMTSGLESIRLPFSELWRRVVEKGIFLESFSREVSSLTLTQIIPIEGISISPWSGDRQLLLEHLEEYRQSDTTVLVMAGTERAVNALMRDLDDAGISANLASIDTVPKKAGVYILPGGLSSGMEYPQFGFAVITQSGQTMARKKQRRKKKGEEIRTLSDLHKGDLVVHLSHGIGRFDGITKLDVQGIEKDYIKIIYAGSDVLYLPVTQLDLISRYIGGQSERMRLNKLGGDEWKRTRSRAKKAITEMAQELIQLYAQREKAEGYAFSPDTDWQRNFEEHFPYDETEDQLRVTEEIKRDMEKNRPMDRLLCGDVGYGKTEVALRAAFKCILDGKQCAFLCPTTILAWQHYQTVLSRMGEFPIKVELLSRFRTPKQQKEILKQLKCGEIDLLIGTHRIVQKDVLFHDLGLAIIDEEQRFGVTQKERFKEVFHGVDVLTLSATPIPRTLNMAMSGIRDMSVLEQPPQNRQPIQTYVMEYRPEVISEAIRRELRRGGQVYYLHNRVESIIATAAKIHQMAPNARIGIAHGQMNERELSEIWHQLIEQELDILVCTTIIETGVDLPNCNTLIVENADRMGLSQLYQLRGRVGRSGRRAFAYFTFRSGKVLSDVAAKRLSAIREFTRFGSGFQIALRDLEIRGAGSVLGEQQHGHMEAVGYDMYLRLLSEAVGELKGEKPQFNFEDCVIDIPISAHIPDEYISNLSQRLEVYRKIAALRTEEDRMDLIDELIDRFGEPPKPVIGLMEVSLLRVIAVSMGFTEILQRGEEVRFYLKKIEMEKTALLMDRFGDRMTVHANDKPYFAIKLKGQKPIELLKEFLLIPYNSEVKGEAETRF